MDVTLCSRSHTCYLWPRTHLGATSISRLELRKNMPLFAKVNVIFIISVSFSTLYEKIILVLQFFFNY